MAVRCEGDCKVMEQLGEKQDFEAELSRRGFAHEAFLLHVRHGNKSGSGGAWAANYSVAFPTSPPGDRASTGAGRRGLGERICHGYRQGLLRSAGLE